jgi:hypothetical protein
MQTTNIVLLTAGAAIISLQVLELVAEAIAAFFARRLSSRASRETQPWGGRRRGATGARS